jgi:hypothetical protein
LDKKKLQLIIFECVGDQSESIIASEFPDRFYQYPQYRAIVVRYRTVLGRHKDSFDKFALFSVDLISAS